MVSLDMYCCSGEGCWKEGKSGDVSVGRNSAGKYVRASYVDCIVRFEGGFKLIVGEIRLMAVGTQQAVQN
jgi:hypothetical protein